MGMYDNVNLIFFSLVRVLATCAYFANKLLKL